MALKIDEEEPRRMGVSEMIKEVSRIGVLVHNAGHMTIRPTEVFAPEQPAAQYEVIWIGAGR